MYELSSNQQLVLSALAKICQRGPMPSTGKGDMAVGKTLLDLLGVPQETTRKPTFQNIVLTTRRGFKNKPATRVNLFAMVPNWSLSKCKSSQEIALRYGYDRDGARKLYASVRSRLPNSQGLYLYVDRSEKLLRERYLSDHSGDPEEVAAWRLTDLQSRLLDRHPASAWITASVIGDSFHYRYVQFTEKPRVELLPDLIQQGIVTMDHLIKIKDGRSTEKGPLFKIDPENISSIFQESPRYDLMNY